MEQRLKERPTGDCPTWGSILSADTKPDTVAIAKRYLRTWTSYDCYLGVSASNWPIQMWMLGANHQTELMGPGWGADTRTGGTGGNWNPHRKNNISWLDHSVLPGTRPPTKSCIGVSMATETYVAEKDLDWHQWERRPLVLRRFDVPV